MFEGIAETTPIKAFEFGVGGGVTLETLRTPSPTTGSADVTGFPSSSTEVATRGIMRAEALLSRILSQVQDR